MSRARVKKIYTADKRKAEREIMKRKERKKITSITCDYSMVISQLIIITYFVLQAQKINIKIIPIFLTYAMSDDYTFLFEFA